MLSLYYLFGVYVLYFTIVGVSIHHLCVVRDFVSKTQEK